MKTILDDCLEKSKKIAEKAHSGQIRKLGQDKGKPYIIHPQRVASKFDNHVLASIAFLHDILEDTEITEEDLKQEGIPFYVINAVKTLTRKYDESYLDFILRTKKDILTVQVKIADIEDNLSSLQDGSLKDKYLLALYILKHV